MLGKVGLCANEYVDREMSGTLSGGESKRIELATVLARDAKLFIFDEPEAGIDLWSFSCLVETLEELRRQRTGTLLVISHQERILSIADEIIVLAEGRVRISGPRPLILPDLLSDERAAQCRQPVCPATAKAVRDATAKAVRDATAKSDRDAAEGLRLGKTEEGARRT